MTRAVAATASQLAQRLVAESLRRVPRVSDGIVRLDNGDPEFATPLAIRRAMSQALDRGFTHYGHPHGDPELRGHLAAEVSEGAQSKYSESDIVVTHGATGALASSILGFVDPGDAVLLPEPTYSLYADLVRLAGGRVVYIPSNPLDFSLDTSAIADAAAGARMLILCSPCNPTGALYTARELTEIAAIARRFGLLVLADETYDHIVYDDRQFYSLLQAGIDDQLIYVQSFSKRFAMTGWRIGYVAAKDSLAGVIGAVHRTLHGPLNAAVQRAAIEALEQSPETNRMVASYAAARDVVVNELSESASPIRVPDATFYAFVKCPAGVDSDAMVQAAEAHGVLVRPGSEYGPSGRQYIRISFAVNSDALTIGLSRLRVAMTAAAASRSRPSADLHP